MQGSISRWYSCKSAASGWALAHSEISRFRFTIVADCLSRLSWLLDRPLVACVLRRDISFSSSPFRPGKHFSQYERSLASTVAPHPRHALGTSVCIVAPVRSRAPKSFLAAFLFVWVKGVERVNFFPDPRTRSWATRSATGARLFRHWDIDVAR